MRTRTILLGLVLMLGLVASTPASTAVGPGAQVYIAYVGANQTHYYVPLKATSNAAEGNVEVLVTLTLESPSGTAPQAVWENTLTITIPAASNERAGQVVGTATFDWDGRQGIFRVTAQVRPANDPSGPPWDEYSALHRYGSPPSSLVGGWGMLIQRSTSSVDLDEDGTPDLQVTEPGTGQPRAWDLAATLEPWESRTHSGYHLDLQAWSPTDTSEPATITLDGTVLRNLLRAQAGTELRINTAVDTTQDPANDAVYQFTYTPSEFPEGQSWARVARVQFTSILAQRPMGDFAARGWYDGYQTRVNVTTWDLDGDAVTDLFFWDDTAQTASAARAQSELDRRAAATKLIVHARVNDTFEGRTVEFEVRRHDGQHTGAWMEIRSPESAIRQALWANWMDDDAQLQYQLSLPDSDGFVEERANTTWVWFGHFSPQYLRILLPYNARLVPWGDADGDGVRNAIDAAAEDEPTPTSAELTPNTTRDAQKPVAGVPGAPLPWLLALGLLLGFRRPGVRPRRR